MWRKYHRVVALIIVLPFAVVLITGIILQLRQQFEVIQPKAVKMERLADRPLLSLERILEVARIKQELVDQIVYRPEKFHLAVRFKNGHEMQIHPQTGEVLKSAHRYTNILIDIHQGSLMGSWSQYLIFLPAAFGALFLTISGLIIYPWRRNRG
jgi:uncharacterized iron-regulated membrane protein